MNVAAELVGKVVGRVNKSSAQRPRPKARRFLFEPLEPRLLLSATPFYTAAAAQAGVDLTLRLDNQGGVETLELLDSAHGVLSSAAVSSLSGPVEIFGSGFADTLTLASDLGAIAGGVLFDGGAGTDTLVGPGSDTVWSITGADAGSVSGVGFATVENLIGSPSNQDRFVLKPNGSLAGGVDGGDAGFDTLVIDGGNYAKVDFVASGPSSGSIRLDTNVIRYAGLEPLILTAGNVDDLTIFATAVADSTVLKDNGNAVDGTMTFTSDTTPGTFESIDFSVPNKSLTINLGTGADTFRLEGLDNAFNAVAGGKSATDLIIKDPEDINITSDIIVPGNLQIVAAAAAPLTDLIGFSASRVGGGITVADGVTISAGGNVDFIVIAGMQLNLLAITPLFKDLTAFANIEVGDATINGQNITFVTNTSSGKFAAFDIFESDLLNFLAGQNLATFNDPEAVLTFVPGTAAAAPKITLSGGKSNFLSSVDGTGAPTAPFEVGDYIKIVYSNEALGKNTGDDYRITAVTGNQITLEQSNTLVAETIDNTTGNPSAVIRQQLSSILPDALPVRPVDANGNALDASGNVVKLVDTNGVPIVQDVLSPIPGSITSGNLAQSLAGTLAGQGILDTLVGSLIPAEAIISKATSTITLKSGAVLNATGAVTLEANTVSTVRASLPEAKVGVSYVDSESTTGVFVKDGAAIGAGGDVSLQAVTRHTMTSEVTPGSSAVFQTNPLLIALKGNFIRAPGPSLEVAYGKARSFADAVIESNASVIAGGNLDVASSNNNVFSVSVDGKRTPNLLVGRMTGTSAALGVAFSDTDSRSNALVAGKVQAGGGIAINASAVNAINDTRARSSVTTNLPPGLDPRTSQLFDSITTKLATTPLGGSILNRFVDANKPSALSIAAGVAFVKASNQADAAIGANATVRSIGDLSVIASTDANLRAVAVGATKFGTKASIGGAVAITTLNNTANASIGDGAKVDAGGLLTVEATAKVPNQIEIDNDIETLRGIGYTFNTPSTSNGPAKFFEDVDSEITRLSGIVDAIGGLVPYASTNLAADSKLASTYVGAGAGSGEDTPGGQPKFAISGSVDLFTINNTANAWIGAAQVNTDATSTAFGGAALPSLKSAKQGVSVAADAIVEVINIVGIPSVLSLAGQTKASGAAVGGVYTGFTLRNKSNSYIADGAVVNAGDSAVVSPQATFGKTAVANNAVTLDAGHGLATGDAVFYNNGGGASIGGLKQGQVYFVRVDPANANRITLHASADEAAAGAGAIELDATNAAATGHGLSRSGIAVTANTENFIINVSESGASANKFVFEGVVNYNDVVSEAVAHIEDKATITAANDVIVDAGNKTFGVIVGAGWFKGGSLGIGVSVAINQIDSNTQAFIGNLTDSNLAVGGSVSAGRAVSVEAASDQRIYSVSVGGGLTSPQAAETPTSSTQEIVQVDPNDPDPVAPNPDTVASNAQGKAGIGIAGAASVNDLSDTTKAFISGNVTVSAGQDVSVTANNDAFILGVAGAGALNLSSSQGGGSLAGAVNVNLLDRTVLAFTENATISARNIKVEAHTRDQLITVAAGAAIVPNGTAAILGSVNVNLINSDTEARLGNGTTITAGGDVTVDADDKLAVVSVAGGFTFGNRAGFGAAVDVGIFKPTVKAQIATTASVNAVGDVRVTASSDQDVVGVAISLAGSQGIGIAGSASSQNLVSNVEASVGGTLNTQKSLLIDAEETTDFITVGGGAGLGLQTAGIGIGIANNNLNRNLKSFIAGGANVNAQGNSIITVPSGTLSGSGILIDATAKDTLISVGAGGSFGGAVAFSGSVVVNTMTSNVDAFIGAGAKVNENNALASSVQSVRLRADEQTNIISVAGSVAVSRTAGIGGAADVEVLTRNVKAHIDAGATVNAQNDVTINAGSQEAMTNVAASVAAGGTAGISGSAAVLVLNNDTEAFIGDNARVSAEGSVVVAADGAVKALPIAGSIGAGAKAGVGLSNATIVETDTTKAFIGTAAFVSAKATRAPISVRTGTRDQNGNPVNTSSPGGVAVMATSRQDLDPVSVSFGGGLFAGISAAAPVVVLNETTQATIGNNALINQDAAGIGTGQGVTLIAADWTDLTAGVGGGAFGAVGIGVGASVNVINKNTQASIGTAAKVNAGGSVSVKAVSEENLLSISASAAVSGLGLGGSAGVYVMDLKTKAIVGAGAVVAAEGNVDVAASDKTKLAGVAGNGTYGGAAGVGAAAVVPVITKQTHAFVDNDAQVIAKGNRDASTINNGNFDVGFTPYAGAPVVGEVRAPNYSNSNAESRSDSGGLSGHRLATPQVRSNKGLSVVALNQDDIEMIAVSGALGGSIGLSLAGSVNVHTTDTRAYIGDRATINIDASGLTVAGNAEQSVIVAAGNDHYHLGVGGAIAGGGGAGVGPGVDIAVISNTTNAHIGKSAQVRVARDVQVSANATEEFLSIAVGAAGGGAVGLGAAVSVITLNNQTHAYIDQRDANQPATSVLVGGNVLVSAADNTKTDIIAGSGGLGLGAGIGAAVGVTNLKKDTLAYIAVGAFVTAGANSPLALSVYSDLDKTSGLQSKSIKGIGVQATSSEDLFTVAAAGGGGGFVGLAGGVSVSLVNSNTRAFIGESTNVSSAGTISVGAFNNVKIKGVEIGATLAGIAGVAGGVDVGIVKNQTEAFVGNNANVNAGGSLDVVAFSIKDVDSLTVSGGIGGVASLTGAVSVYSIGADITADARNLLSPSSGATLTSTLDSQATAQRFIDLLATYKDDGTDQGDAITSAQGRLSVPSTSSDLNQPITGATKAHIGLRAKVSAGDDVNVRAKQQFSFTATAGQGSLGFVGLGGSVVVANITEDAQAYIEPFAQVSAGPDLGDDINVEAGLVEKKLVGKAYGGQGGGLALGAQVVIINDSSRQLAYIDQGTIITRADHLNVLASAERPAEATAGGVGIGGIAAGASVGKVSLLGSTTAFIGDSQFTSKPATIRLIVNYVNVTADAIATAKVDMFQAAGGIGAGAGNDASAIVTPTVTAFIAGNTNTQARNTVSITARSEDDADAHAYGVDVGGLSVGVSIATATASPVLDAYLGKGGFMTAGQDVIVQAVHNYKVTQDAQGTRRPITETNPTPIQRLGDIAGDRNPDDKAGVLRDYGAYATSFAASGNLVGGNGATSTANASAQLSSHVDNGAVISAGGNVSLLSLSLNGSHALASGVTFSIVAGGGSKTANANSLGATRTFLDGRISRSNNVDVQALASDTGNAVTDATAAAIGGAGQNSTSTTNVKPVLLARIGTQSLNPATALSLSESTIDLGYAHGFANGQGLIYDNGNPKDKAVFDPTKAGVVAGNTIDLGGNYQLVTGNEVIYRTGGGSAIAIGGGQRLVEGRTYFVIATADPNKIRLAASAADAAAGNALTLDATQASGKLHSVDGNRTGLRIVPAVAGGSPQLINGKTYFVIAVAGSPTKIKLAETAADALAGKAITFDNSLVNVIFLASGFFGTQHSFTPPGTTPFITANGNVKVLSSSFSDGDAAASGLAGSVGISVGLTNAFTTVSPTLTTFVGQNGSIIALGNVTVQSQQGRAIAATSASSGQFDPSTAVQAGNNSLSISNHGFASGEKVAYGRNGGGDIGLEDQRSYTVISIDANTIKLGDQFVSANVNGAQDTITFAQSHSFKTGDEVIYDNGGGASTGGLTSGARYFVQVIDGDTVRLFASKADATAVPVVFSASAVANNKITLPAGAGFVDGQIIDYSTTPANFDDSVVGVKINADGTRTAVPNTIFFGTDYFKTHVLNTGERIRYHTDNRPLTGLINNTEYFVINNGDGSISLAATAADAAAGTKLAFSAAPTSHALGAVSFTSADVSNDSKGGAIKINNLAALGLTTGTQLTYDAQNGVAIGGLVDGASYFVIIDTTLTDTLRLASTASLAASNIALQLNPNVGSQHVLEGNGALTSPGRYRVFNNTDGTISLAALSGPLSAVTLNAAGVFGTQILTISPIDLASVANANPQSLTVALKTTADTTKASLAKQGSVILSTGARDGIATATANAAAFSLLGSGTGSETKVTVDANVNTFVDKRTTISGKDVSILSSSSADLSTSDTNKTGAFIAATNPLASSSMSNNNKAYLGSDAVITAAGKFNLDSRVAQTSTLFVRAEAGAGIALAGANNGSQGARVAYNNAAIIGQNAQVGATGTLDAQASAATIVFLRVEADGQGFGANGKAAVFLNAPGTNTVEVQEKAKLSGTVVSVNADTIGSLGVSTDGRSAGFASEAVAQSTLNASLGNSVNIRGKASITGSSGVNLNARVPLLVAFNGAFTQTTGAFSGGYPETFGNFSLSSVLSAPNDAKVITNALTHNAQAIVLPFMNNTTRDVRSIDFGRAKNEATSSVTAPDQFAGTVLSFPQPLLALKASAAAPAGVMLSQAALDTMAGNAIAAWERSGRLDQSQLAKLHQVRFHIEDLDDRLLGLSAGTDVAIDRDAAGYGWFIDKTPARSEEFGQLGKQSALAGKTSPAAGKIDLLSVIDHEIGHVLGLDDAPRASAPGFMSDTIAAGERISPFGVPGAARVFDEASGTFTTRQPSAGEHDEEFVRITAPEMARESLYALHSAGKRQADSRMGSRPLR